MMNHSPPPPRGPTPFTAIHILMSESSEDLDLSEGALAVGLVLKRTDLLDGHFGHSQVIKCRAGGEEGGRGEGRPLLDVSIHARSKPIAVFMAGPDSLAPPPTHHTIPYAPSPM